MILLTSLRVDGFLLFFSPLIYIFAKIYKIYIMEFLVNNVMYIAPFLGLVGLFVMFQKSSWVTRQNPGNNKMVGLADHIAKGAMAFLMAEWRVLAVFAAFAAVILAWSGTFEQANSSPWIAASFLIGAFFSALSGYFGMNIATKANVRTTQAARTSLPKALKVSFTGGTVMGVGVASLAVLGLGGLFIVFYGCFGGVEIEANSKEMMRVLEVLAGFSLGAESIALLQELVGVFILKLLMLVPTLLEKLRLVYLRMIQETLQQLRTMLGTMLGMLLVWGLTFLVLMLQQF